MAKHVQREHQSFWLWVMCLTGVDYFSTLGYQPSIAFAATGLLAPLATVVLVVVTLGYLAHGQSMARINPLFGRVFGTIYDISTVAILWFAGASAMSGLLNLVPRYLPRYGMAPKWAEAFRPIVLFFTAVNLLVTWVFGASVAAQGGAYATGVMVLMTSACVAVVIHRWHSGTTPAREQDKAPETDPVDEVASPAHRMAVLLRRIPWLYVLITLVFLYTTVAIVIEKPNGIKIAGVFILAVVVFSMVSRTRRSMELRFERFDFVDDSSRVLWDTLKFLEFPVLVPHRPGHHSMAEKDEKIRRVHRLDNDVPIVFVEATLGDTSEFEQSPLMEITESEGRFVLRVTRCVSVAHAITSIALELSRGGKPLELHFGWSDESPLVANLNFVLFGEGNVPWLVRELLEKAEPEACKRPRVIVG